jgi:hypothetical protein
MSQPQSARAPSPEPGSEAPRSPGAGYSRRGSLFAIGAATAVVAVPLALELGMWVGTRSSSTVMVVVPALLVVLLVPPLAVVVAESVWGRRVGAKLRTGVAVGAALGTQVLTLAAAIGAGVSAPRYGDAVLLTMVEALVLPLVVTRLAYQSSKTPTPSPSGRGQG